MSFFAKDASSPEMEANVLETGKASFKRLFSGKGKAKEAKSAPPAMEEQPSYFAGAEEPRGGQPVHAAGQHSTQSPTREEELKKQGKSFYKGAKLAHSATEDYDKYEDKQDQDQQSQQTTDGQDPTQAPQDWAQQKSQNVQDSVQNGVTAVKTGVSNAMDSAKSFFGKFQP